VGRNTLTQSVNLLTMLLLILLETSCCCNNQADVNLSGYRKHLQSLHAPKPLTLAEEELQEIKRQEVQLLCTLWLTKKINISSAASCGS